MNIDIRRANLDDLKSVQDLNNELFEFEKENFDDDLKLGWPYEEVGELYFKRAIINGSVYVAVIDNNIVGYLAGTIDRKCSYVISKTAELDNMCINHKYRRLGIGKMLISKFKEECIKNNVKKIVVTASSKNKNAIDFYKLNGFEDYNTTFKMKI